MARQGEFWKRVWDSARATAAALVLLAMILGGIWKVLDHRVIADSLDFASEQVVDSLSAVMETVVADIQQTTQYQKLTILILAINQVDSLPEVEKRRLVTQYSTGRLNLDTLIERMLAK